MTSQHPTQSTARDAAVVLLDMLLAIDESARLDMNPVPHAHGGFVYEARIYGKHLGFVYIGAGGELVRWT